MGMHKKDHIWSMLSDPSIGRRWEEAHGAKPTRETLDTLYEEFTPLQVEVLKRHCDVIPGVAETVKELRRRGIKIASTTGFDSGMMGGLVRKAAEGGFAPDVFVCPDLRGQRSPRPLDGIPRGTPVEHLPHEDLRQARRYSQRRGRSPRRRHVGRVGRPLR